MDSAARHSPGHRGRNCLMDAERTAGGGRRLDEREEAPNQCVVWPEDRYGSDDPCQPGARSAQANRKGRWAVSERLPILGPLLRTAQPAEPQNVCEEGPLPDRLVPFGRLLPPHQALNVGVASIRS